MYVCYYYLKTGVPENWLLLRAAFEMVEFLEHCFILFSLNYTDSQN